MANKSIDISNYTDLDLYAAFLPFLKRYLKGKGKRFPKNMPLSFIVDLIIDEIGADYDLEIGSTWGSEYKAKIMIRGLVEKGLLKLPSQRPKVKFTRKYKKVLDRLFFSKINLPPHAKVVFKEDEPYDVEVNTIVDWGSAVKDPRFDYGSYITISKNLPIFLNRVLNIEHLRGNPIKGEVNIDFNIIFNNQNVEEIIKEIKTIIKKYYGSDKVRSLRFNVSSNGKLTFKLGFPHSVYWNEKGEIRKEISRKLLENGFNITFIQINP